MWELRPNQPPKMPGPVAGLWGAGLAFSWVSFNFLLLCVRASFMRQCCHGVQRFGLGGRDHRPMTILSLGRRLLAVYSRVEGVCGTRCGYVLFYVLDWTGRAKWERKREGENKYGDRESLNGNGSIINRRLLLDRKLHNAVIKYCINHWPCGCVWASERTALFLLLCVRDV